MAASSLVMAPMPAANAGRPRHALVAMPSTGVTYPATSGFETIGCVVGSRTWANDLAVDMKVNKAFGHGSHRLLEHST